MVVHMRHTRGHTRNRRSHHALSGGAFATCEKCGTRTTRHTMCANCGSYRGRVVLEPKSKVTKNAKAKAGASVK